MKMNGSVLDEISTFMQLGFFLSLTYGKVVLYLQKLGEYFSGLMSYIGIGSLPDQTTIGAVMGLGTQTCFEATSDLWIEIQIMKRNDTKNISFLLLI